MALDDTMRNAAEHLAGKAEEAVGKATDDERLEAGARATRPARS